MIFEFGAFSPDYETFDYSGKLVDLIEGRYPGQRVEVFIDEKFITDYRCDVTPANRVDIYVVPGAPVGLAIAGAFSSLTAATVVSGIVSAVASAAIGLVVNRLFGAKPGAAGPDSRTPTPGTVSQIGAPRNTAQLGQVIPVQYGRVWATPDIASQPYTWYEGNEQYLAMLLCLGQGEFEIHAVQAADTDTDDLAPGVYTGWTFPPAAHGQVQGAIQAVTGLWEDVETSPEVSDQELVTPEYAYYQDTTVDLAADTFTLPTGIPSDVGLGDALEVQDPNILQGTYTISAISASRLVVTVSEDLPEGTYTENYSNVKAEQEPDGSGTVVYTYTSTEDRFYRSVGNVAILTLTDVGVSSVVTGPITASGVGTVTIESTSITGDPVPDAETSYANSSIETNVPTTASARFLRGSSTVGPFVAAGPGSEITTIQVDVVFPSGLYAFDDGTGGLLPFTVDLEFTLQPIDGNGDPAGSATVETVSVTKNTNTPQRITYTYTTAAARYTVSARRTSPDTGRAQDQSQVLWTGLKAVHAVVQTPVYGAVTMVMVKLRATNGLASGALDQITVDCTRKLEGVATQNPAPAMTDAWTNATYGGGRGLDELDQDALSDLRWYSQGSNGFNHRFTSVRSLWDAMGAIVRPVDYYPVPLGGLVSLAQDAEKPIAMQAFSDANMTNVSAALQFDPVDAADGFEVAYTDTAGQAAYALYPASSVDPERVLLEGCTDGVTALSFAQGLWLRSRYRRKYLSWRTELEGRLAVIGSKVSVDHPLVGTEEYVIQSVTPAGEYETDITAFRYDSRAFA